VTPPPVGADPRRIVIISFFFYTHIFIIVIIHTRLEHKGVSRGQGGTDFSREGGR
jgi:hypothetical protein